MHTLLLIKKSTHIFFLSLTIFCNPNVGTTLLFLFCYLKIFIILKLNKNYVKNGIAHYIFSNLWSSILENLFFTCYAQGLRQRGSEPLMFSSLWVELQFKLVQNTTLVMKNLLGSPLSKKISDMLLKIFRMPIIARILN